MSVEEEHNFLSNEANIVHLNKDKRILVPPEKINWKVIGVSEVRRIKTRIEKYKKVHPSLKRRNKTLS